jgi:hypothetical protein
VQEFVRKKFGQGVEEVRVVVLVVGNVEGKEMLAARVEVGLEGNRGDWSRVLRVLAGLLAMEQGIRRFDKI